MIKNSKLSRNLLATFPLAFALVGCGGGGGADAVSSVVSDVTTAAVDVATLSSADAATLAVPFVSNLSQLVDQQDLNSPVVTPQAGLTSGNKVYTPAQIRVAYQLPALPFSWSNLSASQATKYGAGQTIYIVDAMHDPNIAAELNAFNTAFGLPACTTSVLTPTTALPLDSADVSKGCEFAVAYSSASAITSTPPTYDSSWATEIALDVQWAHATAPLARIVLIEAPSASVNDLLGAVNLANAMGPGVVSMSFGANEGSWMSSVDSAFSAANMTYLAATGDSGKGVSWPSASSQVLAVGGTSLSSYTSTSRNEVAWTSTGGGISQYITVPSYQTLAVPGLGTQTNRNVADVAFNADPSTGQYTAVIPQGSTSVKWYSVGGTSLATPQWAGVVAVTNATRSQSGQGPLGLVQNFLYQTASSVSNFFSTIFKDIVSGSNGYSATNYYDIPTGLGSPNVSNFITLASGSATAPVVSPINVNGRVGSPISFSMAFTSPDPVTWALSDAPTGMSISSSGLISWPSPVSGTYAVTVAATDSVTTLTGTATATITVTQSPTPIVESTTINGQTDKALSYQVTAESPNPVSFTLSGAVPTGLAISQTGLLTWTQPVVGSYAFKVNATDTKTSAVGSGDITVKISAASTTKGPTITAPATLTGAAKRPLATVIGISDPDARYVSVNLKGAPAGMSLFNVGQGVKLSWLRPVAGTYTLVITAKDNNNLSTQATIVLTVN
jgi:subtilase family serine protease